MTTFAGPIPSGGSIGLEIQGPGYHGLSARFITYAAAAPTSGTYAVGDFVLSGSDPTTASAFVCVVAGTPGTWKSATVAA